MRSLKSRLFGFGVAAFFGTIVVVGCSASGGDGDLSNIDGTDPEADASKILPSTPEDGEDTGTKPKDAGKSDAGKKDASTKDATTAPPSPETGDACTTVDDEFTRACGMCGVQEALCLADLKVSDYGVCKNQKVNGCVPGTTEEIACGNCGKVTRTCSKYCEWTQGGCSGQPANSCSPGSVEFTDASCGTANTYKFKTCQNTCQWGNLTTSCAAPPTTLQAPPTAGSTNTSLVVLNAAQTMSRIPYTSTCPISASTTFGTAMTAYTYIEVKNPNPKATSVAIYTTKDPSTSTSITSYLTAYDGASPPAANDTARRACKGKADTTALTYPLKVTIPANASVSVLIQASSATSVVGTGTLMLNVLTETVAP